MLDTDKISLDEIWQVLGFLSSEGQPFETHEEVINGISYRAFNNIPAHLRDYYQLSLAQANKDFIVYKDERYTFAETLSKSWALAKALQDDFGVTKGDRVAIAMKNYPEWMFAFIAATSIGAICAPLNGWWTPEELRYGVEHSGARVVLVDQRRLERIAPFARDLNLSLIGARIKDAPADSYFDVDKLMDKYAGAKAPIVEIAPQDPATLLYTSGSTGKPKGVLSNHRAIISTLMNWIMIALANKAVCDKKGVATPENPAVLNTVPLFHVTGCHAHFLVSFPVGRKIVVMPKWDATLALELLEKEKVTTFHGVPMMSRELMNAPDLDKYDLSELVEIGGGGAARAAQDVLNLKKKFPQTYISIGYGLTETNAIGSVIGRDAYLSHPDSIGRPLIPMVEVKIIDESGAEVPNGEKGEILIKSICNFMEYWKDSKATAEAITEGWFHTGDVGYMSDEGYLYIVDRLKDIIIRGGENISCLEVEDAIFDLPEVAEVSVFGVPDEKFGEIVGSAILFRKGMSLDREMISEKLSKELAHFKIPEVYFIHDKPLPRLGTGKIDKVSLRKQHNG